MPVWELPVQRLLVLERSTQQAQRQQVLVQRAWAPVQESAAVHQVQAGFHDFQSMRSPSARRAHFPFAARPI